MWQNQGGFNQTGYGEQAGGGGKGGDGGGGGYMSPGGFGTPQQSQERKTRSKSQHILPCTIAQILKAEQVDDKFFTSGIEISQITIVGLVRDVKESSTRLDYEIDDMTGPPFMVKQFADNDESAPDEEKVTAMRENTYVRVCGHLRSFAGKRSIVAFRMIALTDMNELSAHLLEVIHSHATLSASRGSNSTSGGDAGMDVSSSTATYNNAGSAIAGLSPLQSQIQLLIKSNVSEAGASIESVREQLRNVAEKQIREAVEFLSAEGHIYSTIDDDHFKATDS